MFQNYLRIALRNLLRHRLYAFINVFGLATAMMVCLIMLTHVKGAFDYDDFHPHRARIYRVLTEVDGTDLRGTMASTPLPLADVLRREYGALEQVARVVRVYGDVSGRQRRFDDLRGYAVEPAFFSIFGYPFAAGGPATGPNTVVLTQKTAGRFFGTANPIGQVLRHAQYGPLRVAGVLAPFPSKSHLKFDLLLGMGGTGPTPGAATVGSLRDLIGGTYDATSWKDYPAGYTYVLLRPGTPVETLEKALTSVAQRVGRNLTRRGETAFTFRAQALTQLSPSRQILGFQTSEPQFTGLLAELFFGGIILLLAGFNYVNLTLARSLGRAREVGIRKVAGARRSQLVRQFLLESVGLSLLALGVAYGLFQVVKPMATVQEFFVGDVREDARLWLVFVGFAVLTGVLAGLIPARVLSAHEPATVLRSQTGLKTLRGLSLRKSLVVAQFTIALTALIVLLTMYRQHAFMATADYGFRRANVLNLPLGAVPHARFADALRATAGVEGVSPVSDLLGADLGYSRWFWRQRYGGDSLTMVVLAADEAFVPTMNLRLLVGENLPPARAGRAGSAVLLNEAAVRALRLNDPRAALGQTLWLDDSTEVRIAGVLADFNYASFAHAVYPLVIRYQPEQFRYLNVAVAPGREAAVRAEAERLWRGLRPYEPFGGRWYDQYLAERHRHTDDMAFFYLLIGIGVSIACLGLLGMVSYQIQVRTKEVGIRKVMGATVAQVVALLSWSFVKLLMLAGALALPLGYLLGTFLLHNFVYRVGIGLETLGVCLGVLLVLGGLTIGWKTYRAALMNPTDSLRSE